MEQVGLAARTIVGEVNRDAHRFAGPHQHGVFPAKVTHGTALAKTRQRRQRGWAVQPFDHLKSRAGAWDAPRRCRC